MAITGNSAATVLTGVALAVTTGIVMANGGSGDWRKLTVRRQLPVAVTIGGDDWRWRRRLAVAPMIDNLRSAY